MNLKNSEGLHNSAIGVVNVLNRFANCFDTKEWTEMEHCLDSSVYTDYFDLRGTPPTILSNVEYVALRRAALDQLITHHLFANHEVEISDECAKARVSSMIFRRSPEGETLHTHCVYSFELIQKESRWLIRSIVQKVLWNEGNKEIRK